MNDKFLYLTIDICCVFIPLFASFYKKIPFYREWRHSLKAIAITATIFIIWDMYFTHINVWRFNYRYLLGINIANLPLEEVLFFILIPYACLFIYFCVERFIKQTGNTIANIFSMLLIGTLFISGVLYLRLLYTSTTFLSLSILLFVFLKAGQRQLNSFLISFILALFPFFISNGLLTGSWIAEPVVIYNNNFNLNIRLLTIPVEDLAYGMAFQLLNVILFNSFRLRALAGSRLIHF